MKMFKILGLGLVLGALLVGSSAQAASTAGCQYTSPLRSRDSAGRLVYAWSVMPVGGTFVATSAAGVIVLVIQVAEGQYTERPLYWPTPTDPQYDYRKMTRLPVNTKLIGNDYAQHIRIVDHDMDFMVDGVQRHYTAVNYNGHYFIIDGCGGIDRIEGGLGSDHIYDFSDGDQTLWGGYGRDWVEGSGTILGGPGDDCVLGGVNGRGEPGLGSGDDGNDLVNSYYGTAFGGSGEDTCFGPTLDNCEHVASNPIDCAAWF